MSVGIGGIRPKTVSIDNYGLVKFVGPNKEVILSIHPEEGPKPPSALRMYPWGKTPTSQTSKPSGVPKPPPAIKMASLALDKRNQILNPRCKYVSVPFAANKNPKSTFNIELVGCGTTSAMDDVFVRAAQTWMNIISGDVTAFEAGKGGPQACLTDSQEKPVLSCGYIDDIIVGYSVEPEDGNAKAVAWGTPLDMRSASSKHRNLPYSGWMQIDSADYDQLVADGLLYSVILHEMGHVLGFGTVWSDMNLLRPRNCADLIRQKKKVSNPRFFGSAASKMLTKVKYTAGGRPPVDGDGDQGTACFHWADDRFNGELMTGYVSAEPLISVITVASLQDIGYQVDLNSPLITPFDASGRPFNRLPGAKLSPVIKMGTCLDNPTRNRVRHERSLQAE